MAHRDALLRQGPKHLSNDRCSETVSRGRDHVRIPVAEQVEVVFEAFQNDEGTRVPSQLSSAGKNQILVPPPRGQAGVAGVLYYFPTTGHNSRPCPGLRIGGGAGL